MTNQPLRIGTRASRLALFQAEEVKLRLQTAWPDLVQPGAIEIVPISTSGEWKPEQQEQSFHQLGGNKGWFTKNKIKLGDKLQWRSGSGTSAQRLKTRLLAAKPARQ